MLLVAFAVVIAVFSLQVKLMWLIFSVAMAGTAHILCVAMSQCRIVSMLCSVYGWVTVSAKISASKRHYLVSIK